MASFIYFLIDLGLVFLQSKDNSNIYMGKETQKNMGEKL